MEYDCGHGRRALLVQAVIENVSLAEGVSSWFQDFIGLLNRFGGVPSEGLVVNGRLWSVPIKSTLALFDAWFYSCWRDLPEDPRTAPEDRVACCKYQEWFAVQGGSPFNMKEHLDRGHWTDSPPYVRNTGGVPKSKVRALAAYRLGAHDLDIETRKWRRVVNPATGRKQGAPVPREQRLCGFCWQEIGDEMHMVFKCGSYQGVRERHGGVFELLGGCEQVTRGPEEGWRFRMFMLQDQARLSSFCYDCARCHWADPPVDLAFMDAEDSSDIIQRVLESESDAFFDAFSDEFIDAYSEEYVGCEAP